jgi:hypothetical protein
MKGTRFALPLLVVCALALTLACGDRTPTGVAPVAPTPDASLIGDLVKHLGLLKCSALPYDSTTKTIGPLGGSLTVGPHTLWVPPGSLTSATTITAVLSADTVNAVRFKPEGLQFRNNAYLTMSYANCNLLGLLLPKRIAYTDDSRNILEYLLSIDIVWTKQVTGRLKHFSEYAVAW